jgi:hypothetical protein
LSGIAVPDFSGATPSMLLLMRSLLMRSFGTGRYDYCGMVGRHAGIDQSI